jgi:hypothetical protein
VAAALYLVEVIGPHVLALTEEVTAASERAEALTASAGVADMDQFLAMIAEHRRHGEPLARVAGNAVSKRLTEGWDPADPLLHVNTGMLALRIGRRDISASLRPKVRPVIEQAVAELGLAEPWARRAPQVLRADDQRPVAWTEPLGSQQVYSLASLATTATLVIIAAVSGMRNSELMEIVVGSRLAPVQILGRRAALSPGQQGHQAAGVRRAA